MHGPDTATAEKKQRHARRAESAPPRLEDDAARDDADLDDIVAVLSGSLSIVMERAFRQGTGLGRSKNALAAEVVASAILASWSNVELTGQRDPAALLARAMLGFLESKATPDALALIHGFGAVHLDSLVPVMVALGRLDATGIQGPRWAEGAGRARLESAWVATDVFGDHDFLVGRYSYAGDTPHDVAVLVDHNVLHITKDASIVPAAANLRAKWERAPDIEVRDLDEHEYADRLADALDNLAHTWEPPLTEDARRLRPLLDARLTFLPRPRPIKRREVSEAARARLYSAFRRSEPGRALGRDSGLARIAIDYAADYRDDPLRWSPIALELFLTDWLPRKVTLRDEDIEHLPTVLRAWLRFVGEQRGFPARLVDEMWDAVAMFEMGFREAMRDSATFGPAKSVAQMMAADGVDFRDEAAVQAWIEAFNARPLGERDERIGGPFLK